MLIGNVVGWQWSLGDGNSSMDQNPSHLYESGGDYSVVLYIEDENGCIDSTLQVVTINDELLLMIPNAFSPNGDDLNDVFRLNGLGFTNVRMQIFNRWGEKLLDEDSFESWDGTYNGEFVQTGVYIYLTTITDNRGRKTYRKGEIHVVR